jgi:hypothetical protein
MELSRKLGIRPNTRLALIDAPGRFREDLEPLPEGVEEADLLEGVLDCIVVFVRTRGELAKATTAAARAMAPSGSLWIAWPKQLSGYTTDVTAEAVQATGLRHGLLDTRRLSVNDAWTAMRFIVRVDDREAWAKRSFDE